MNKIFKYVFAGVATGLLLICIISILFSMKWLIGIIAAILIVSLLIKNKRKNENN